MTTLWALLWYLAGYIWIGEMIFELTYRPYAEREAAMFAIFWPVPLLYFGVKAVWWLGTAMTRLVLAGLRRGPERVPRAIVVKSED